MKHQPTELTVDSLEELNLMVESQDFILAKSIVEGILNTINTDEPQAHLLAITVKSEGAVYDITVAREDFAETLQQNLTHYIREEEYEQCRHIANTVEDLKQNNLSKMVTQLIKLKSRND